ncbi:MAG: ATP-grasp domain-containing protein [Chloroflexi bacterium]|nr:ATP-grasp domain-containing protein [Chloroflexota bacterium]
MNVVFLSPHFPPTHYLFCVHLRTLGATVLGIADEPYEQLRPELRAALTEYYRVSDLHHYDELLRAIGYFTHRHGKIQRIDSLNEYWLETEARLRTDFNIAGFKLDDLPGIKRKSEMKRLFQRAKVEVARGQQVRSPAQARAFVAEVGYPVVAKPDIGVGANRTYKIASAAELEEFLARQLTDYILEEYIHGVIQTFDGLTDRSGAPVFFTSMQYSSGVMEVVTDDADIYYLTERDIPPDVEQAGRRILKAFNVHERFFHFEFFRTPEGRLVALEVNMRPPGGLSIDMFNYANDIDLYYEWASVLLNDRFNARYNWPYHVCYAGRKYFRPYALSHGDVLARFGNRIVHHQPMASMFHRAMGEYGYLIRSTERAEVVAIAREIQRVAA